MRIFGEVCGRSSGDSAHRSVFCTETDPCSLRRLLMRAHESGPESKSRDPGGGRARRCSGRVGPLRTGTDVSHTSGDVSVDASNVFGTCSPAWPPSVWAWDRQGGPGPAGAASAHGTGCRSRPCPLPGSDSETPTTTFSTTTFSTFSYELVHVREKGQIRKSLMYGASSPRGGSVVWQRRGPPSDRSEKGQAQPPGT